MNVFVGTNFTIDLNEVLATMCCIESTDKYKLTIITRSGQKIEVDSSAGEYERLKHQIK